MPTLHLTDAEQTLFEALSADLQARATVERETLTFTDTDQHRASRLRLMHLKNPVLKEFQESAQSKTLTADELAELAGTIDLSSISKDDVMELAFAWGPDVFRVLIAEALPEVKTGQDLQEVADLSNLRHGLLLSFNR
jgi:hypothetical protein